MRWRKCWPETLLALFVVALEGLSSRKHSSSPNTAWTAQRKLEVRERVRDLWYHGFDSYMAYAFPQDELAPLTCTGRGPDLSKNSRNWATNDVAGNFSLTLIDALDTFVILNDAPGFEAAVQDIIDNVSFDVDTRPQVFETTIRVLGGLLSGHIWASRKGHPCYLPWYNDQLLALAHDLGNRLLPAFNTPTGIPYARLNLRHGVQKEESIETCTAGAGSLILEFGTLSRLTGDNRFEKAAYKAFFALWNRRSDIGLVGNTINIRTGAWNQPEISGIGAGIDSFYEYALKWYVLSGDVEFLDVWHDSYAAVMRYVRGADGFWFKKVNIHSGNIDYNTVDSLAAFWPGLQVLAGDVENAIKAHLIYWNLWEKFSGLPEVWDTRFLQATSPQYPLRPEFVESTWYLYRATHDPFYLDVGIRIMYDIEVRAKVDCGFAGIKDLGSNAQDDRMESFVLSETLKYLYLLFDDTNTLHTDDSNYVFTTEGHLLLLDNKHLKPISPVRQRLRGPENLQCPAYSPPVLGKSHRNINKGLTGGIRNRHDTEYARYLVGTTPNAANRASWSPNGYCEVPIAQLYSYNFILSHDGSIVPEDTNPVPHKLSLTSDGYIIHNITGIRANIVSRLDGKGYDITRLGPHVVRSGQIVYVNDRQLGFENESLDAENPGNELTKVNLRFYVEEADTTFQLEGGLYDHTLGVALVAFTSSFGGDPTRSSDQHPLLFNYHGGVRIAEDATNSHGCHSFSRTFPGDVLVVQRGECTFLEKLLKAKEAGASGVVVFSDVDHLIRPSADQKEIKTAGVDLDDVVLVVLPMSSAKAVREMMDTADRLGFGDVLLIVDSAGPAAVTPRIPTTKMKNIANEANRVLFLNGHPLINTRLLV